MEFTGQVRKLLPVREGVSQRTGNEWKALPFVFEYFENENDRYADNVLLETFDTEIINRLQEGATVHVGFGHRTREYNGRYYNDLRVYKIEILRGAAVPTTAPSTDVVPTGTTQQVPMGEQIATPVEGAAEEETDLPF